MENIFFKLLARLQTRDRMVGHQVRLRGDHNFSSRQKKKEQEIFHSRMWACIFRVKWYTLGMHNALTRSGLETNSSWDVSRGKEKVPFLQWICWVQKSRPIVFFHVCYHAGGSTKHLRRLKVKRRDEESSPSDTLTPKKRKTRLAGKMRTYLRACPLTATSQPHLPFPCFCKIEMRGSSKMAWIDAVRSTRYSLILMLCCDVFMFFSQARSSQRRRFKVALPKLLSVWKRVF